MSYVYQIFPILPDWSSGFSVKYRFETVISLSERFVEQRKPMRGIPVVSVDFNALMSDMRLIDYLKASIGMMFFVPMFNEGFQPTSYGIGLTVVNTTNYLNYFFMRWLARDIIIMSKTNNRNPICLSLVGIGSNSISFESNSWVFDNDTVIFPALRSYLLDTTLTGITAGLHSYSINFSSYTDGQDREITVASANEAFPGVPDWSSAPSMNFDKGREIIQFNSGTISIRNLTGTLSGWNSIVKYFNTKDDIYSILSFFASHRGKYKSFWTKIYHHYLKLNATTPAGSVYISIDPDSMQYVFYGNEKIFILLKDGTEIIKQIVQRVGANIYQVSSPFAVDILPENVALLGKYIIGRFDQDELSISYSSMDTCECEVKIHELVREYIQVIS